MKTSISNGQNKFICNYEIPRLDPGLQRDLKTTCDGDEKQADFLS